MAMDKTKGKLVSAPSNITYPRDAKFSAPTPKQGADMQGNDSLVKLSANQCRPAGAEDGGDNKPMPEDRSRIVASNFKTEVSKAEAGTSVSAGCDVSFKTGKHS